MITARPQRDEILMQSAWLWSRRSTCSRLHVGAVFARDGRILVSGYNGAPAGIKHCDHSCDCVYGVMAGASNAPLLDRHSPACRSRQPCIISEHAERNGIAYAARHGVRLEGSEAFVTNMPCLNCAMTLINAGVVRVVYDQHYRVHDGVKLLQEAGLVVDEYHAPAIESIA